MRLLMLVLCLLTCGQGSLVFSQDHYTVRLKVSRYGGPPEGEVIAFSPDSSELAIGTDDATFFVRTKGAELAGTNRAKAFSLTYSKDGKRIHLISNNGRRWLDAVSKKELQMRTIREQGFVGLGLENRNGKLEIVRITPGGPVEQSKKFPLETS